MSSHQKVKAPVSPSPAESLWLRGSRALRFGGNNQDNGFDGDENGTSGGDEGNLGPIPIGRIYSHLSAASQRSRSRSKSRPKYHTDEDGISDKYSSSTFDTYNDQGSERKHDFQNKGSSSIGNPSSGSIHRAPGKTIDKLKKALEESYTQNTSSKFNLHRNNTSLNVRGELSQCQFLLEESQAEVKRKQEECGSMQTELDILHASLITANMKSQQRESELEDEINGLKMALMEKQKAMQNVPRKNNNNIEVSKTETVPAKEPVYSEKSVVDLEQRLLSSEKDIEEKDMEISSLRQKHEDLLYELKRNKDMHHAKTEDMKRELQHFHNNANNVRNLDVEVKRLQNQLQDTESKALKEKQRLESELLIAKKHQNQAENDSKAKRLENDLRENDAIIQSLKQQLRSSEEENGCKQETIAELKSSLSNSRSQLADIKGQFRDNLVVKDELDQKEDIIIELQKKVDDQADIIDDLKKRQKVILSDNDQVSKTNANDTTLNDSYINEISNLQRSLDIMSEQLKTSKKRSQSRIDSLQSSLEESESKCKAMHRKLKETKSQLQKKQNNRLNAIDSEKQEALKEELKRTLQQLSKSQSELTATKKELEVIKASEGKDHDESGDLAVSRMQLMNLQSTVDDKNVKLVELSAQLEETKTKLKARIEMESSLRKDLSVATEQLMQLHNNSIETNKHGASSSNMELKSNEGVLNDDSFFTMGTIAPAQFDYMGASLTSANTKIANLEAQISASKGDMKAKEEAMEIMKKSLKEALSMLRPLQSMVSNAEDEKNQCIQDLKAAQEKIALIEREGNDSHFKENKKMQIQYLARITDLENELKAAEKARIQVIQNEKETVSIVKENQQQIALLEQSLDDHKKEINNLKGNLKMSNDSEKEWRSIRQNLIKRIEEAEKEALMTKSDLEQREMQFKAKSSKWNDAEENYRHILEEKDNEVFTMKQKLENIEDALETTKKDHDKLKDEYEHLNPKNMEAQMEIMKTSIREAKSRTASVESELFDLQKNFTAKMKSEANLKRQLQDAKNTIKVLKDEKSAEFKKITILQEEVSKIQVRNEDYEKQLKFLKSDNSALETEFNKLQTSSTLSDIPYEKSFENSFSTSRGAFLSGGSSPEESMNKVLLLESKLLEQKSLYDVTKRKLDQAIKENGSLKKQLEKLADEVVNISDKLENAKETLIRREKELENAKYIATCSLMKIDELTGTDAASENGSTFCSEEDSTEFNNTRHSLESMQERIDYLNTTNTQLEAVIKDKEKRLLELEKATSVISGSTSDVESAAYSVGTQKQINSFTGSAQNMLDRIGNLNRANAQMEADIMEKEQELKHGMSNTKDCQVHGSIKYQPEKDGDDVTDKLLQPSSAPLTSSENNSRCHKPATWASPNPRTKLTQLAYLLLLYLLTVKGLKK